jgi:hypothetical protein
MGRRKAADKRLEQARRDHAEADRKIGELEAVRADALLADKDDEAARLDAELETLRRMARGYGDKIALLVAEAEHEEAEARIRRHEVHIRQVEKLGDDFVAAGIKLAEATANLVAAYRETLAAAERRGAAWPWAPQDQAAAMLTGAAVQLALSHEFFRTSHVPFLGGRPGEKLVPSLPGSSSSRPTDWLGFPEREPPLIDVCKTAAEYARRRMREISAAQPDLPPPTSDVRRSAVPPINGSTAAAPVSPAVAEGPPPELAALLRRQADLAADPSPEGEVEYLEVVKQIAALQ